MNFETRIDRRLWEAITASIEKRNYTGAILDSTHFLSSLLRQKTGLDGDGTSLVGQAFGGANPKLKVNRLQTESEKNIQKGMEQLLRGIYQAIRNPRSHDKYIDKQEDAEAIILFINWLINIIDKSKTPFTLNEFLGRVFDCDFMASKRYADLIVGEIPFAQRTDIFLEVYRRRDEGDGTKLSYFFEALCALLTEEQKHLLAEHISEELISTNDEAAIRLTIQCIPAEWWLLYKEVARLRIENKLIQSIRDGRYYYEEGRVLSGALGAWASRIAKHMLLKTELVFAITQLLISNEREKNEYAFAYFFLHTSELRGDSQQPFARCGSEKTQGRRQTVL
jgi:uncharacterized protein (TIGR02391 family)